MTEKILVPVLGESITEATISKWLKSKGENINADEPIVELETDKVNLEVPSPINGTLTEINFKDGDNCRSWCCSRRNFKWTWRIKNKKKIVTKIIRKCKKNHQIM